MKHTMKNGHTQKLSRIWSISSGETSWQNIVIDNKVIIYFARENNINNHADSHSDDYDDDGDEGFEKDGRG